MKKHIPNFITSLNLFTGCVAVLLAFRGDYQGAFIAILVAAVFDFLDGFAARLLKAWPSLISTTARRHLLSACQLLQMLFSGQEWHFPFLLF